MDGDEEIGLVGAYLVGAPFEFHVGVGKPGIAHLEPALGKNSPDALGDVEGDRFFADAVVMRAGVFAAVPGIDEDGTHAEVERFGL